jgi:hypothetical protein
MNFMSHVLRDQISIRRGVFRAIGCVLVAFSFVGSANTAIGSCGDYLHDMNHRSRHALGADHQNAASGPLREKTPAVPRCSGPECHHSALPPTGIPQSNHQRATFNDLCTLMSEVFACDAEWSRLEQLSKVSLTPPDPDRPIRPPQAD